MTRIALRIAHGERKFSIGCIEIREVRVGILVEPFEQGRRWLLLPRGIDPHPFAVKRRHVPARGLRDGGFVRTLVERKLRYLHHFRVNPDRERVCVFIVRPLLRFMPKRIGVLPGIKLVAKTRGGNDTIGPVLFNLAHIVLAIPHPPWRVGSGKDIVAKLGRTEILWRGVDVATCRASPQDKTLHARA